MSLREHIDFHNRELISIVEFARLWSAESGNSLSEIYEFLRVVLKKDRWRHGVVHRADGKRYFHDVKIEKIPASGGREKMYQYFDNSCFFGWLEQARDEKNDNPDHGYYLTREYYIHLLESERLPIPTFLIHPSARPTPPGSKQPPQSTERAIVKDDLAQQVIAKESQNDSTVTEVLPEPHRRKPPQAAQRDDALSRLARKTYKALCDQGEKPTYRQVIDALKDYNDKEEFKNTVEEIDSENELILWVNDRGKEQKTSFADFKKRLTRIRKTMPSS